MPAKAQSPALFLPALCCQPWLSPDPLSSTSATKKAQSHARLTRAMSDCAFNLKYSAQLRTRKSSAPHINLLHVEATSFQLARKPIPSLECCQYFFINRVVSATVVLFNTREGIENEVVLALHKKCSMAVLFMAKMELSGLKRQPE
jgi:hypothetical protein